MLKKLFFLRSYFCFCKIKKTNHPVLSFKINHVIQTPYQKHFALILDEKLNFDEHLRYIANKHPLGYYVNFKNVYQDDH